MTELSAEDLDAIRQRTEVATPGPWQPGTAAAGLHHWPCHGTCHNVWSDQPGEGGVDVTAPCGGLSPEDAAFIASARQDIPALLSYIAHLEGILSDMASDGTLDHYRRGYADGLAAR